MSNAAASPNTPTSIKLRATKAKNVWSVIREQGIKVDVALPCATQNEINGKNARH